MSLYSVEVKICATAYIRAESKEAALAIAKKLEGESPSILDHDGGVEVTGCRFSAAPDISLSPAMTIHGPWDGDDTFVDVAD